MFYQIHELSKPRGISFAELILVFDYLNVQKNQKCKLSLHLETFKMFKNQKNDTRGLLVLSDRPKNNRIGFSVRKTTLKNISAHAQEGEKWDREGE